MTGKSNSKKKNFTVYHLHPWLILLYFYISLFSKVLIYKLRVNLLDVTFIICFYLLIFFIAKFFIRRSIKNSTNAHLILSGFLIILLFFSTWSDVLLKITFLNKIFQFLHLYQRLSLLVILLIIFAALSIAISKNKHGLSYLGKFATFYALALLLFKLFETVSYTPNHVSVENNVDLNTNKLINNPPDIYYIIMDCYTGNNSFLKYWKYDNSGFTNELKRMGFYIADQSRSNYNFTRSSLASSLNSSYLNVKENIKYSTNDVDTLMNILKRNQVISFLKNYNYQLFSYSIYDIDNTRGYKVKSDYPEEDIIPKAIFGSFYTPLFNRVNTSKQLRNEKIYYDYDKRSFAVLDSLSLNKNHISSNFYFIHSLATHGPFVIDSAGNFISTSYADNKKAYLREVQYANKRLLTFLNTIMSRPGTKPILIIQGDHGSHLNDMEETSSILNGYYFPDLNYQSLYPAISPVNTFRVIFNKYFNTNLSLLPDKSYHVFYGSLF